MKDIQWEELLNGKTPLNGKLKEALLSEADYLEEVPLDSDFAYDIEDQVNHSYLDPDFKTRWRPYRIELVKNKHLLAEYDEKQKDLLIRGRKGPELEERNGFVIETGVGPLEAIVSVGLQTKESDYNPLGYSMVGVYICRHADICIQHALVKHPGTTVIRLVMFKYRGGKKTTAIPRQANAPGFIEPTQGYDCHVSALPPQCTDPLQTQFDRSQAYLYEINKLLQPSARPRQVLPFAVITFTEDGMHVPAVDAKPTIKEKLDGNPRLQQIIKAINSKADKMAQQKTGKALMPGPPPPGLPGMSPPLNMQGPSRLGGATSPPLGGVLNNNSIVGTTTTYQPGTKLGLTVNGSVLQNGSLNGYPDSPGPTTPTNPEVERNPQLMDVINRINSRLAAEDQKGKAEIPNAKALQGSHVIMGSSSPGVQPYHLARPTVNGVGQGSPSLAGMGLAGAGLTASAHGVGPGIMGAAPRQNSSMNAVGLTSRTSPIATGYNNPSPLPGSVITDTSALSGIVNGRYGSLAEAAQGFSLRGASPAPMVPAVSLGMALTSQSPLSPQTVYGKQFVDYGHTSSFHAPNGVYQGTNGSLYQGIPGLQTRGLYTDLSSTLTGVGLQNVFAGYGSLGMSTISPSNMAASSMAASLQPNSMAVRAVNSQLLKRSYPDSTSALAEWDKRPKYC